MLAAIRSGVSTARLTVVGLVLVLLSLLYCARSLVMASPTNEAGASFFTNGAVQRFEVELSPENVAALRISPREYVPGTVRVGGQTYTNVGIHLKGVATFRPIDNQPSLTLNFSKFAREQRFHGLRKIHLNNGKEDPTFLCEAISADMFAQAGLPVARVTHARPSLNGRDLGPYVLIEGFTPEFLGRYFKNTKGNLYDSGFRREITYPLEKLQGKKPHDWADLKQLSAAAVTPDLKQRWELLAGALDTNSFARYLAMQVLTANWDGYGMFQNNYRIYHDPDSERLFFMPHGMDQTFAKTLLPLKPPRWVGLVARSFMETPEGRSLYERQLGMLFTNTYHTAVLTRRVDELAARVRPIIAERNEHAALEYDWRVAELRRRIEQRGRFIAQQLATNEWGMSVRPR